MQSKSLQTQAWARIIEILGCNTKQLSKLHSGPVLLLSRTLQCVLHADALFPEDDSENTEKDNRNLVDGSGNQKLSRDDIEAMKKGGVEGHVSLYLAVIWE